MTTTEITRQQLLIGGDWTDARSRGEFEQTFPYTGERVGVAAAAGREDARAARWMLLRRRSWSGQVARPRYGAPSSPGRQSC